MTGAQASPAPPLSRLASLAVNALPALAPACSLYDYGARGVPHGHGGVVIGIILGGFAALGAAVVVIANALLLARQQRTLGLAYQGLRISGAATARLLLAEAAVLCAGPVLAGVVFLGSEPLGESAQFRLTGLTAALWYAFDWALCLGKGGRTLSDRLGGGRVVFQEDEQGERSRGFRLSDAALILLPLPGALIVASQGEPVFASALAALAALLVVQNRRRKRGPMRASD